MSSALSCLRLIIWGSLFWSQAKLHAAPSIEDKFNQMVPGGVITLDMIVDLGYRFSDGVGQLKADLEAQEVPVLFAQQNLDGLLSSTLAHAVDKRQQSSQFAAQVDSAQDLSVSYQKNFQSGTSLSTSLSTQRSDLSFSTPTAAVPGKYTSEVQFTVRQSLWKNAFGKAVKADLLSAKHKKELIKHQYQLALAQWFLQLEQIYHQAWLAQKSVANASDRVKTQKRLLKVIKLLKRRGTAEEADVLNVEQNLLRLQQGERASREALRSVWQQLVIVLKLPEEFLQVNPMKVRIAPSQFRSELASLCQPSSLERMNGESSPRIALLNKAVKSAELDLQGSQSRFDPDLYVAASLGSNGIDDSIGTTIGDAVGFGNPNYSVAVGIDMPLGRSASKADIIDKKKVLAKARLNLSSQKADTKIAWRTTCDRVKGVQKDMAMYRQMLSLNKKRSRLEEKRFSLGKSDVQTVIAAANDVILSQASLASAELNFINGVWRLKELNGDVEGFIKSAVKNSKLR